MTGAACRAGTAYPSGAPDFTPAFYGVNVVSFPMVCLCSLFCRVVRTHKFCLKDCLSLGIGNRIMIMPHFKGQKG